LSWDSICPYKMSVFRVVWIRSLPAGRQQAAGSRSGAVTGGITLASFGEISRLGTTKMRLISAAVDYPDRRPTPRIPVLRAGTPMIDSNTRVRVEFSRRTRTSQRSRFHDETLTTEERMERHLKRPRAVEPEGRYYLHVRRTRRRCGRRRGSGGRDSHWAYAPTAASLAPVPRAVASTTRTRSWLACRRFWARSCSVAHRAVAEGTATVIGSRGRPDLSRYPDPPVQPRGVGHAGAR